MEPCPQVGERASCSSSRPSDETAGPASHAPATLGGPQPQLLLHKGQGQLGCQRAGRGEQSPGSQGPTGRSSHKSCLPSTAALACQVLPNGTACPHPGGLQDLSGRWATLSRLLPSALQRERTWTASACPAPHLTRVPHVSLPPLRSVTEGATFLRPGFPFQSRLHPVPLSSSTRSGRTHVYQVVSTVCRTRSSHGPGITGWGPAGGHDASHAWWSSWYVRSCHPSRPPEQMGPFPARI